MPPSSSGARRQSGAVQRINTSPFRTPAISHVRKRTLLTDDRSLSKLGRSLGPAGGGRGARWGAPVLRHVRCQSTLRLLTEQHMDETSPHAPQRFAGEMLCDGLRGAEVSVAPALQLQAATLPFVYTLCCTLCHHLLPIEDRAGLLFDRGAPRLRPPRRPRCDIRINNTPAAGTGSRLHRSLCVTLHHAPRLL